MAFIERVGALLAVELTPEEAALLIAHLAAALGDTQLPNQLRGAAYRIRGGGQEIIVALRRP